MENITVNDKKKHTYNIGTHNGLMHSDENFAVAFLSLCTEELSGKDADINVTRTREKKDLAECDIVVDIGEGKYDHHYKGFSEFREDKNKEDRRGSKFASAGLVHRDFGHLLIETMIRKATGKNGDEELRNSIYQQMDKEIVESIDLEDNGISANTHLFDFIPLFNPSWHETQSLENFDAGFKTALGVTMETLRNYLQDKLRENGITIEPEREEKVDNEGTIDPKEVVRAYLPVFRKNMAEKIQKDTNLGKIEDYACDEADVINYVTENIGDFITSHESFRYYSRETKEAIITRKIQTLVDEFYGNIAMEQLISKHNKQKHSAGSILEIPAQTIQWSGKICENNGETEVGFAPNIAYVLFPYPSGGYALQAVPPSIENKFAQTVPLVRRKDGLPEGITKINGTFFATGDKEALIELARSSVETMRKAKEKEEEK